MDQNVPTPDPATPGTDAAPVTATAPGATTALEESPTASPAGWGAPAGFGSAPVEPTPEAAVAVGVAQRKQAIKQFVIAVVLLGVGLGITYAATGHGGLIWIGAFLVAASLLVRSVVAYRGALSSGATSLSRDRGLLVVAGAAVVACLVGVVLVVGHMSDTSKDAHASTGVGSCWKDGSGSMLQAVDCSHDHQYVGRAVVSTDSECPTDAVGTVTSDDGRELCLARG
ncbi:hypothetical protein [Luteimicrobium subarcticum]|uniref:Uncharacterized protein n=1 Tax=Luteimicrobium subarcticum TaxID=620910 RepID=A0A2M8WTN7_9MICO|nr:hypothetical protein [Luteimicrobium subarcticum]PJI94312.1 hypothetical protein CLV34_0148 [Luteimicrobium subarcticum]